MWVMFLYDSAVTANELNEICKHSVGSQNTQEKNSQVQDGGGGGGAGGQTPFGEVTHQESSKREQ